MNAQCTFDKNYSSDNHDNVDLLSSDYFHINLTLNPICHTYG